MRICPGSTGIWSRNWKHLEIFLLFTQTWARYHKILKISFFVPYYFSILPEFAELEPPTLIDAQGASIRGWCPGGAQGASIRFFPRHADGR